MTDRLLDPAFAPPHPSRPPTWHDLVKPTASDRGHAAFLADLRRRLSLAPMRPAPRVDPSPPKSSPPNLGSLVFSRAAFGSTPSDHQDWLDLGATDAERLVNWVDWQLEPDAIPDSELDDRLADSRLPALGLDLYELWTGYQLEFEDIDRRFEPMWQSISATVLRALYSRRQLAEVLADFWHNHFSVYGFHFYVAPVFPHWDREVIRAHMLGNFRTFLEAMAAAPAMAFYLDNIYNSADGPNENFARELLELHTLGEASYFGAIPAAEVPRDPHGVPLGYVDEDVRELARCLTGWSLDERTGDFLYRHPWHDDGAKTVLGLELPAGSESLADFRAVLDLLAHHPGTARFVAGRLCRRLVADDPPQSLVDAAAAVFLDHADAADQLERVVRAILLSDEFAATWGDKVRRPFETTVAALRAMGPDFSLPVDATLSRYVYYLIFATGQLPHTWAPPTGFPDRKEVWLTTNAMVATWRMSHLFTGLELSGVRPCDPVQATPSTRTTATEIADYWIERALLRPTDAATRAELIDFMADDSGPDDDLDLGSRRVRDRLRAMVGLVLTSPDFYRR